VEPSPTHKTQSASCDGFYELTSKNALRDTATILDFKVIATSQAGRDPRGGYVTFITRRSAAYRSRPRHDPANTRDPSPLGPGARPTSEVGDSAVDARWAMPAPLTSPGPCDGLPSCDALPSPGPPPAGCRRFPTREDLSSALE
jgi:hypothetical protein